MLYEVTFLIESRATARLVAKQLVSLHLVSTVEITLCDIVDNVMGEVVECSRAKLVCLTTRPKAIKAISEAFKQENILISLEQFTVVSVEKDDTTTRKCIIWCGEETDIEKQDEQPTKKSLTSSESNKQLRVKRQTKEKDSKHSETKTKRGRKSKQAAEEKVSDAASEKMDVQEEVNVENLTNTDNEEEQLQKKTTKLPKWAEEEGLTLTEYKKLTNWRSAARWGMTFPEYALAASYARKLNIPLKKYLQRIGRVYDANLDVSFITLDYISSKKGAGTEETASDDTDLLDQ